ncbi:MAG: hypothetical protein V9F46_01550 [Chitinophagaceae bacterium]
MWIIIIIIVLFLLIKFVFPFIAYNSRNNTQAFNMLNDETKRLILNEDVLELATLITGAEMEGDYRTANILLDACLKKRIFICQKSR